MSEHLSSTNNSKLPLLAIALGDPAGIGPESAVKALAHTDIYARCRPLVIGDARIVRRAAQVVGSSLEICAITSPEEAVFEPGAITVLDLKNAAPAECPFGQERATCGKAAVESLQVSCDLALRRAADAIVTGPLNKAAMNLAGFHYPGQTELLAERCGAERVTMLLTSPKLRVVHVTTHVALEEAIRRITTERVFQVIELAQKACLQLGIAQPRIAVAGLNPHAGEGGLFGTQESEQIRPAIEQARSRGWDVADPQPGDTVFLRASQGKYDIVVAMYHDQGHIPVKLLGFDSGVNVSLGLPIIRTSVDHGTAFDIAGKGIAREDSMIAAIDMAIQLAQGRAQI